MGLYQLTLPKMGESVSEATLTRWLKNVGDRILEDDAIVEIATDKVDSDVPSPVVGVLKEQLFQENQVVRVGDVIATIEIDGETAIEESVTKDVEESIVEEKPEENIQVPGIDQLVENVSSVGHQGNTTFDGVRFYSPLVRNIAQQENISQRELDGISGTGVEGRLTKEDLLSFLEIRKASNTTKPIVESAQEESNKKLCPQATITPVSVVKSDHEDEIMEMDRMRRLISDHMVHSVKTSPHVFSVVEADVTNLVNWRNKVKDAFKKREGENVTFTPLIVEAIAKALKDFPMMNVSVDGYNIIKKKNINIGMAAALPTGNLIVPVIKNADQLNLLGICKSVNDLANRARTNKLKPDDTQGGTFTFTNIGAFGNIFGMPIINQPQAAILAVGTIKKKPAVLETPNGDVIAVRHFMYISMSYDHRVIDGALGGTFVKRVSDYLENWDIDREI